MAIKRRTFIAGLGSTGLGVGLGGFSHFFPLESPTVGPDWSPGDESFVPSTCTLCPSHCGILGRVFDGRLVRIDGNPLHPVSRGGLCPKGRAGLQLLYHPGRLKTPQRRQGSAPAAGFESTSWDTALQQVADALGKLRAGRRPERMAWLVGDVQGNMDELIRSFVGRFGSPHLLRESYADGSDEVMQLSQGIKGQPAFDLERADLVVSFGAALSEAWWCLPQAARARDRQAPRRCHWVQLDTRLSRTAVAADRWLALPPGSYGLLAISIAYVLLKEGLYDADWVNNGVTGFADWTDDSGRVLPGYQTLVLRHGSPEQVAPKLGLDVQKVVRLAKDFGRSERPLAVWDQSVTWHRGGLSDALAIHALNILTGSLERAGGVYVQPAMPAHVPDGIPPGPVDDAGTPPSLTQSNWAEQVLAADECPIDLLFLYHSNPVASAPNPDEVRQALERIPLVVSFSPFLDESANYAHLVLPDHTYLERWQDLPAAPTVPYPVWSVVQPMVPPLHDTRATGDVVLDLASRVEGLADAFPWRTTEQMVQERGKGLARVHSGSTFASGFRRGELQELEARGWWIPHGQSPSAFWKSLSSAGGWFDPYHDHRRQAGASRRPDGRAALFPEEARRRIGQALPGMVEGFLPSGANEVAPHGATLRLMPYRLMTLASGTIPLMPWLLENLGPLGAAGWEPWVEIHPETARELGLDEARDVRVISEHGAFTAKLRLFEGAQPGLINAPYGLHTRVDGWGAIDATNPLVAVGSVRDPVTGLPDWYGTEVRVEVHSA